MKKDVAVVREAIKKIVNLLTNRSIQVTQRGSRAYVQYHSKTGAIQLVNLPYIPDDASEEFIAAVQGFLDHEVGHVLFTDPKMINAVSRESAKVKNLANAIEDVYVERRMSEAFSGSVANLNAVRRFHIDKISKPKIEQALAAGDMGAAAGYIGLVQFRAWGGQQIAADFLRENPKYAEIAQTLADKLGEELISKIKKANSTKECLSLAKAMAAKLSEPSTPPGDGGKGDDASSREAGKGKSSKEGKSTARHADEDTRGDDTRLDEDKPAPEDEGTTETETDDSGKKRDEKSMTEEEAEPEAGDAEGAGEDADRAESEDDQPGEAGEADEADEADEAGDDGDDGEGEDTGDAGGDDGEPAEPEGEGDADDAGDGGEDDLEDVDGPVAGDPVDDQDVEPDSLSVEEPPEGGELDESGEEVEDRDDALSSAFDSSRDFDEEISEALSKAAKTEIETSAYQVFSTDWDEVAVPAPKCIREDSITRMVNDTQHMVAGIQKALERALAAKARKTWNPGQRRGRIAPGALFKTAVGDERVFRQRYETQAKNTAVSLLVDCSGSMSWGDKIGTAGRAAFALSSTLERLKINHEVIGFTTRRARGMVSAMGAEGMGIKYARNEALYMPLFKGFGERLTVDAKSRMAHLTEHNSHEWLRENVDGECLQIAARRLKMQRAERHLLIVLSDGCPACPGNWPQLMAHLSKVTKDLESDSGVEVVGIGIMDKNVERYYRKHVVLNNLADLPTTVVGELSKVLLAP